MPTSGSTLPVAIRPRLVRYGPILLLIIVFSHVVVLAVDLPVGIRIRSSRDGCGSPGCRRYPSRCVEAAENGAAAARAPAAAGGGQERVDVFPAAHGTGPPGAMGSFHGAWPHEADRGGRAYSQLLMFFTIAAVEMP